MDHWVAIYRESEMSPWTIHSGLPKEAAKEIVASHLRNGWSAVLGFGNPFVAW